MQYLLKNALFGKIVSFKKPHSFVMKIFCEGRWYKYLPIPIHKVLENSIERERENFNTTE